jgi:DNA-binding response OmpR family regulator
VNLVGPGPGVALVVDDDPEFLEVVSEYLTLHGLTVLRASDGLEALMHLRRSRPQLVVLAPQTPRLGGLEALRRIRAFDPGLPVAVVTRGPDARVQDEAFRLGAAAVLGKPVDLELLGRSLGLEPFARDAPGPTWDLAPAGPPNPAAPPLTGHVLIVDDDPDVCAILLEFLESKGYQTSVATTGAVALRTIIERPPDVVLLDIVMPGLSGVEALPAIRAVAPAVKVIMVSGINDLDVTKRTLALGAFDYVVKPVNFQYLRASIETALMMKSLEG